MKVLLLVAAVCVHTVYSQGAGRAIPIDTENFVETLFKSVNGRIRYDSTNFLVDLSGNYANCGFVGRKEMETISRTTPEGASIGVIQDTTDGRESHTKAVDSYLRPVFENWVYGNDFISSEFRSQIANADSFGCSVRPGCKGQLSVACLFSPASEGGNPVTPRPTPRPTYPVTRYPPTRYPPTRFPPTRYPPTRYPPTRYPPTRYPPTRYPPTRYPPTWIPDTPEPLGDQKAKAFTKVQYREAEVVTGQKWDNSHYLENLSGYETDCSMVVSNSWTFATATDKAKNRGKQVIGLYGHTTNDGSTPKALAKILANMKREASNNRLLVGYFDPYTSEVEKSKEVGCSLIPDCILPNDPTRTMYVVVSCVFEI